MKQNELFVLNVDTKLIVPAQVVKQPAPKFDGRKWEKSLLGRMPKGQPFVRCGRVPA
jgi:hypothetical protein